MARRRSRLPRQLVGTVSGLGRGGDAMVETSEGVVYAPMAVIGDTVKVERIERVGKVLRAHVVEVVEAGPSRRDSPCAHASSCGGCPWIVMDEEEARSRKAAALQSALDVVGAEVEVTLSHATSLGYRRRARLACHGKKLGYRGHRSRDVVDVERCIVLCPTLDEVLPVIRNLGLQGRGQVRLADRLTEDGALAVAVLQFEQMQPSAVYDRCAAAVEDGSLAGIRLTVGVASANWGDVEERYVGSDGQPIDGTVAGFSQAHRALNEALVGYVSAQADTAGRRVLELYSGHGNFSVLLAAGASSFNAVEREDDAVQACRANLAARNLAGTITTGEAADFPKGHYEVVVLDPPRVGAKEVLPRVIEMSPTRIVYVSCDIGTLTRDLRTLATAGMRVVAARAFDMFPQTPHVESVVTLSRRPNT